jgi:hypothetical protein
MFGAKRDLKHAEGDFGRRGDLELRLGELLVRFPGFELVLHEPEKKMA